MATQETADAHKSLKDQIRTQQDNLDAHEIDTLSRDFREWSNAGFEYVPIEAADRLIRALGRASGAGISGQVVSLESTIDFITDRVSAKPASRQDLSDRVDKLTENVDEQDGNIRNLKRKLEVFGEPFEGTVLTEQECDEAKTILQCAAEILSKVPGHGELVQRLSASAEVLDAKLLRDYSEVTDPFNYLSESEESESTDN